MNFNEIALQEFPEIAHTGTITTRQIHFIRGKHGTPYPKHILENKVSRGVFRFSADIPVAGFGAGSPLMFQEPVVAETDEEIDTRISKTYHSLETLVNSVADSVTKSMIVSGAPGVGKSFTIKKILEQHNICDFTFVKGYTRATGIFKLLYENRFPGQVLIFDDSDSVFRDEVSLNLLKGALELSSNRRISWLSEKEFITEDGEQIPRSFDYEGTIIFITNLDFNALISKGDKLAPHLSALKSRSLYLDMGIKTNKELLIRIRQVVGSSTILSNYGIDKTAEGDIMQYLTDNLSRLDGVSLRTVEKLAILYLASPTEWRDLADTTMLLK